MIYFIQAVEGGNIKIGYAVDPQRRLAEIQRMSPSPLRILTTIQGDYEYEGKLHSYFSTLRQYGEWFTPKKELIDFINSPFELDSAEQQSKVNLKFRIRLKSVLARLKDLKADNVPTLSELALEIGVSRQTILKLAHNQMSCPETATRHCANIITAMRRRGYQMDVSDLFEYKET